MASGLTEQQNSQDQYDCPVCLENFRWRLPVATKCGHIFCGHCIECALENFCQRCPVCNHAFDEPTFPVYLLNPRLESRNRATRLSSRRATSVEEFDGLVNGIIKDPVDVEDDDHYNCPICGEIVIHCQPMATECGHVFCGKCIEPVTECPICKCEVSKDELVRLYI